LKGQKRRGRKNQTCDGGGTIASFHITGIFLSQQDKKVKSEFEEKKESFPILWGKFFQTEKKKKVAKRAHKAKKVLLPDTQKKEKEGGTSIQSLGGKEVSQRLIRGEKG